MDYIEVFPAYILLPALIAIIFIPRLFQKNKEKAYNLIVGLVLASGFFIFAQGIANLANAGSINAILIFESARQPINQPSFDKLHAVLDPTMLKGYLYVVLGAIALAVGFIRLHRR